MYSSRLLSALLVVAVITVVRRTDGTEVARGYQPPSTDQLKRTQSSSKPTKALVFDATWSKHLPHVSAHEVKWKNGSTHMAFEYKFVDYGNDPYFSNQTESPTTMLIESLFNMSTAFEKMGLAHRCSSVSTKDFSSVVMKVIDQMLLEKNARKPNRTIGKTNFRNIESLPLESLFNQALRNADKRKKKQCQENKDDLIASHEYFQTFVYYLDEDLVEFLLQKISPILSTLHNLNDDGHHRLYQSLNNFCIVNYKLFGESDQLSCKRKLKMIINQTGLLQNRSSKRPRRSIVEPSSTDVNRDGIGSDSYHESANYVIIPSSGSDYSNIYLLKILAGWALGAYALLGLLAYQAYFIPHVTGLPGPRGPSGPTGDQGTKGIKGMTGPKGVKGAKVDGDPGDQGLKGIKGTPGTPGTPGAIGIAVMGDKGPPGPPGTDGTQPAPGPKGPVGPEGDQGPQGEPGDQGPASTKRRRRNIRAHGDVNFSLMDSAHLLDKLYNMKNSLETLPSSNSDSHSVFIANAMNLLWRSSKSKMGCVKCSLFNFLNNQAQISLDSYIVAGFAHILGSTEAVRLLADVSIGKSRRTKMHCLRRENTCNLKFLANV